MGSIIGGWANEVANWTASNLQQAPGAELDRYLDNSEDALGNPGSPPEEMNRLPTYLLQFSQMLLPSDER